MKKVIGQIIVLTKNIFLKKPDGTLNGQEQFFAGKRDPFRFSGGIVISWWYTKLTFKTVENLSYLISSEMDEFSSCDHKTIQDVIRKTLHEICLDKHVFHRDLVCFGGKNTLFECRSEVDVNKFGHYVLETILENVRSSISLGCVVYTIPRMTGESFLLDSEKIHVVHKYDSAKWNELIGYGYCFDQWDPLTGNFSDGQKTFFSGKEYDYVFVVEVEGTIQGNRFLASLKLRKLLSVIFSIVDYEYRFKVMAKPYSTCLQIPHAESRDGCLTQSEIGELCPYYADAIKLKDEDIVKIKNWYREERALTKAQRNRIEKCAHFINKGMNSSDIEGYINYFVAIDALYGEVGAVSKSIEQGIHCLPDSEHWIGRMSWLFDLRNELVHGGSRYIEEWPKYMKYYRHFSTEPAKDIEKLAFHALANAPLSLCNLKKQ